MTTKQKEELLKLEDNLEIDSEMKEKLFDILHKYKVEQNENVFYSYLTSISINELFSNKTLKKNDLDKKLSDYLKKMDNLNLLFEKETKKIENENLIEKIENRLKKIEKENRSLKKELNEVKRTIISIVNNSTSDPKIQFIPVDIYIDTNDHKEIMEVYNSVIGLIKVIEFEKDLELEPVKGSWYKKFIAKSKEILSEKEVNDRLKEIEYAVEVKILKDQSEIDKNQSEALQNILKSVENIPKAAIKIGSLLVVKITSEYGEVSVQVRSLSILELHLLNKRPDLLLKPTEILGALANMIEENNRLN